MHRPVVPDSVIKPPSVSDGSMKKNKKKLSSEGDVIVLLQHSLSLNELEGINEIYHMPIRRVFNLLLQRKITITWFNLKTFKAAIKGCHDLYIHEMSKNMTKCDLKVGVSYSWVKA